MDATLENEHSILDVLAVDECLILLRWEVIGRIAFADPGQAPFVFPVNFAVDVNTIVFRTDAEHAGRLAGRVVAFQVDRMDELRRVGWSVLVRGQAEEIPLEMAQELRIEPWAPGVKAHALRIRPTSITGRRVELALSPLDGRGYL